MTDLHIMVEMSETQPRTVLIGVSGHDPTRMNAALGWVLMMLETPEGALHLRDVLKQGLIPLADPSSRDEVYIIESQNRKIVGLDLNSGEGR